MADLGSGSYGSVKKSEMAVKRYNPQGFLINWDVLNESSVLRHLNEHGVIGVPMLYRMSSELRPGTSSSLVNITESRMSLGGQPLQDILGPFNFKQTCNYLMVYLDTILNIVMAIHEAGVVHNDLKLNNILIDGSRVMIVDYGLADFDGHINKNSPYHQYYIPERYDNPVCRVSNDIWLMGIFLANICLEKLGKNLLLPAMGYSKDNLLDFLPESVTKSTLRSIHRGEYNKSLRVILPKEIPEPLRGILTGMLDLNVRYREMITSVILDPELPSGIFSRNYVPEYQDYLSEFLDLVEYWWNLDIDRRHLLSADNLVIGINILHRCLTLPLEEYSPANIGLAIYTLIVGPLGSKHMNLFLDQLLNDGIEYDRVFELSLKILNHLNWKVYTQQNTTVLTQWITDSEVIQDIAENPLKVLNMNPRSLATFLEK